MNKLILLPTLLFGVFLYGQGTVQVNSAQSTVESSAIFQMDSDDRALVLPTASILDASDATSPINNPAEGLIVYNDDATNLTKGLYFWSGSKWQPYLEEQQLTILAGKTASLGVTATGGVNLTTFPGAESYTGAVISPTNWTAIPGATLEVDLVDNTNTVSLNAGGGVQLANTGSGQIYEFAIAFFVDGVFEVAKPFYYVTGASCQFETFAITHVLENLAVGQYDIDIRVRNRLISGTAPTGGIFYSQAATGCSTATATDQEMRFTMNAIVNSL